MTLIETDIDLLERLSGRMSFRLGELEALRSDCRRSLRGERDEELRGQREMRQQYYVSSELGIWGGGGLVASGRSVKSLNRIVMLP